MNAQAMALLLRAISLVETGGDSSARGRHGELGAFQMTPAVVAECGGYGQREAEKHLRRLERGLMAHGIDLQPFNLALAWNGGLGAVQRGRAPMACYDYALRVRRTYESLATEATPPAGAVGPGVENRPIFLIR